MEVFSGRIGAGLLFLLLSLLFLSPGIFSLEEVIGTPGADLYTEFYFLRYFGSQSLLVGEIPLWNPYVFGGMPFIAILQTAVFYPLNVIFLLLPLNVAINGSILLHLVLSGTFLYLLLRHYRVGRFGAVVGGIVYTFSAPQVMHIYAGHLSILSGMVWIPLLFLFCDKFLREGRFLYGWLLSLTIAVQLLAGNPQYLFYSMISLVCYFLLLAVSAYRDKTYTFHEIGKKGFFFAFFIFFGALLTAVQFLPTVEMVQNSTRHEATFVWASIFSLPPENLATLLVPDIFGNMVDTPYWGKNYLWEMSAYVGIAPLFLIVVCLCYVRNKTTGFFLFLALLSVTVALGKYTPLFELLYSYVPGFNLFRGSSKFIFVTAFSLSLLAGFGANALSRGVIEQRSRLYRGIIVATAFLLLFALLCQFMVFDLHWFHDAVGYYLSSGEFYGNSDLVKEVGFSDRALASFQRSGFLSACWIAATFLLLLLHSTEKVGKRAFQFLLLLLVILDLFSFGIRYVATFDSRSLMGDREVMNILSRDKEPHRVITPAMENVNSGVLSHMESLGGYEALMVKRYSEFINFAQGIEPDQIKLWANIAFISPLTNLLNAKYLLLPAATEYPGGKVVFSNDRHKLYEIPGALPRAFVVHEAKVIRKRDEIFRELASSSFNPLVYATVEEELSGSIASTSISKEQVLFTRYSPNELAMEVETESRGLLVLGNIFYPGWKAFIDGRETPVRPANYVMQSIEIPPGKHEVVFRYAPASFTIGGIISLLALGILILSLTLSFRKGYKFSLAS